MPNARIPRISLRWLKRLEVYGICEIFTLVSAAPNLNYLCLDYSCLQSLCSDKLTCDILKQQILRLDITDWIGTESDDIQRITETFESLDHLVLVLKDSSITVDSIPLTLLKLWNGKKFPSFNVNGSPSDEAKENLQQWLITNSNVLAEDSFAIEYKDGWLDMWL